MKLKNLFLFLMISISQPSFTQSLQWCARMGGISADPNTYPDEIVFDVESDNEGNIYSCGRIRQYADFNGVPIITYGLYDLFVCKHNCNGQLVWVKTVGGIFEDDALSLELDGVGHIYFTGRIDAAGNNIVNFFDTIIGQTREVNDMYLAKLDTSGNYIWGKFAGPPVGYTYSRGVEIEMDQQGHPTVFAGVSLPGELFPGIFVNSASYIFRFDTSGNVLSYFPFSDPGTLGANDYTIDSQNNYIFTGSWYRDTVYIGGQMLINPKPGIEIFYTAKFDSIGALQWIYMFDDTISGLTYGEGFGVVTDAGDNIYIAGSASVGLKCGNHAFANLPGYNSALPFIAKLTPQGIPVWTAQGYEQYPSLNSGGIAMKANGNLVLSGAYRGQSVFGNDTLNQTGFGLKDVFVAEVDSSGQMLGAFKIPGTGGKDESYCITTDSADNIYIGGAYDLSITINGVTQYSAGGYTDGFIVKYGSICVTGVEENNEDKTGITVYPNPSSNYITINSNTYFHAINISAITGQQLFSSSYSNQKETIVNVNNLPAGIYIVTVSTKEGVRYSKLVVE